VTESHRSENSLMGSAIKSGHSAHYVVTNHEGLVSTIGGEDDFDEIVIPQESQIVPAFIISISRKGLKQLSAQWTRALPTEDYAGPEDSSTISVKPQSQHRGGILSTFHSVADYEVV